VVDMTWAGADGALVELWRNGLIVDLPDNDGVYRDAFRRFENSFTWKLCELHSTAYCSNEVSVVFGASEDQVTVVVKQAGGETISRVMMVEDEK
jgi:hypothetical protein